MTYPLGRPLILAIVFAVFGAVIGCAPSSETGTVGSRNLTPSPSTSAPVPAAVLPGPSHGTMDGGGADFIEDPDATVEDVHRSIQQARETVPFVLRFLEAIHADNRESRHLWNRLDLHNYDLILPALLENQKLGDIQTYFANLNWEVRETEPCHDQFNSEKAASAFPYDKPSICLSVPMIAKVAKKVNLTRRLTAILLHELLHKGGIKEESIVRPFETTLVNYLPEDPQEQLKQDLDQIHPFIFTYREDDIAAYDHDGHALPNGNQVSITYYALRLQQKLQAGATDLKDSGIKDLLDGIRLAKIALAGIVRSETIPLEILTTDDYAGLKTIQEKATELESATDSEKVKVIAQEVYQASRAISDHLVEMKILKSDAVFRRELIPQ